MKKPNIVVVAFSVKQERSVLYRKCDSFEKLAKALEDAYYKKQADFASIRFMEARKT